MMMKPKLLGFLLMAAFGLPAMADNLSEVYRAAVVHDASYAAAQAAYRAAQEKIPQARAGLLPSASLYANTRYNDVEGSFASNEFNSNAWSVSATQPLFRGQNLVAYDQAKVAVQQAENQLKTAEQDLLLRTARAYFDVLAAQDNLEFTLAQKGAIAEQLAAAKRNFEVGTATIVDTHEAQSRFDLAVSQEITARNLLEIKRRALRKLTGKDVKTLATLTANPQLIMPNPNNVDEWVSRSQSDNLDVRIRQQSKQIADKNIDFARAGHYPTLDATASYTDSNNQNYGAGTIDSTATVIGLEFALPLYQGGLVSSQVREAVANQEKSRQELEDALRNAELNTRDSFFNAYSLDSKVKALEAALASSQKSLESTRVGLDVGVRTNIDVLDAEQQVTSARKELALARYVSLQNILNLKAAVGALTPADLEEIDRLLVNAK
jgi:outer membrane protein